LIQRVSTATLFDCWVCVSSFDTGKTATDADRVRCNVVQGDEKSLCAPDDYSTKKHAKII
jgi:hypothetical protein